MYVITICIIIYFFSTPYSDFIRVLYSESKSLCLYTDSNVHHLLSFGGSPLLVRMSYRISSSCCTPGDECEWSEFSIVVVFFLHFIACCLQLCFSGLSFSWSSLRSFLHFYGTEETSCI